MLRLRIMDYRSLSILPTLTRTVRIGKLCCNNRSTTKIFRIQPICIQRRSFNVRCGPLLSKTPKFGMIAENLAVPDWNLLNLKPFKKDCYTPHENILKRSEEEIEQFRRENNVIIKCPPNIEIPRPIQHFSEANFPDYINATMQRESFQAPTAIQAQAWPIALKGYNMVGVGETGSGKTLAYMFPAIIHVNSQPRLQRGDGPVAVIIAPSRELVQQIKVVAGTYGTSTRVRSACLFGGGSKGPQAKELISGAEIVIATPGRLLDFLLVNMTNISKTTFVVLDEADRMLDMGFEPQLRKILHQIRPDRQILMWSATWPKEIRSLAEEYLGKYIHLNVGSTNRAANHNITQHVIICKEKEKEEKLMELIKEINNQEEKKTLIFAETKRRVENILLKVRSIGIPVVSLHSDLSQHLRDYSINAFRSGRAVVLVATDIATRGIDVRDVKFVINFDFPLIIDDYVHRIGRTGRGSQTGTAYTLFSQYDVRFAKRLISILEQTDQEINPELCELAGYAEGDDAEDQGYRGEHKSKR